MIEAREREERERQMIAQAEPQPLRVTGSRHDRQSLDSEQRVAVDEQEKPKDVEDPWEKAKREAPPELSSWQPRVGSRRRS